MQNDNIYNIDFVWSSQKEYFSLKPLYEEDFARAIAGDQGRTSLHLVPARTY